MLHNAYWLCPNSEILDIGLQTHIGFIIQHPEKFNLTKSEITSAYQKHGELLGVEGKARYEIIMKLLASGFIRIRLYRNHWSISADSWDDKTKLALSKWANDVAQYIPNSGKYADVIIQTIAGQKYHYSVQDLFSQSF